MSPGELIAAVDLLEPNSFTAARKLSWLSALDGQIWNELILTHSLPTLASSQSSASVSDYASSQSSGASASAAPSTASAAQTVSTSSSASDQNTVTSTAQTASSAAASAASADQTVSTPTPTLCGGIISPGWTPSQLPYTQSSAALLVPFPYGESIYNYYLQAMISAENGESARYLQQLQLYNAAYLLYSNLLHRSCPTLTPVPNRLRF